MADCIFLSGTHLLIHSQLSGERKEKFKRGEKKIKESDKCLNIQINMKIIPKISHIVEDINNGTIDPWIFFLVVN